jgi:hypothetical protein
MSVIRGSFFGAPFCFAKFVGEVENDLEDGREMVREALCITERERKDWWRGVRSRDIGVCELAIALVE